MSDGFENLGYGISSYKMPFPRWPGKSSAENQMWEDQEQTERQETLGKMQYLEEKKNLFNSYFF